MFLFQVKLCASQVSHHPPAAAHHAISDRGWTLRQEITVASKFRGKYLSIMPLGKCWVAKILSMLLWQWWGCHTNVAIHTCWRTSLIRDLWVMPGGMNLAGWKPKSIRVTEQQTMVCFYRLFLFLFPFRHDSRDLWKGQQPLHLEESYNHSAQHYCGKTMDRSGETGRFKARWHI